MDFAKTRLCIWVVEKIDNVMLRFNKEEECRCMCLDKICNEYDLKLDTVENIRKIDNFIRTYNYLKNKGLIVEGYIDKRLLINPKYLFYLMDSNITFNKKFFDTVSNCIYMYYSTARELYCVSERWTHCICEIYKNGQREIFDSYWEKLQIEHSEITFLSHENLKKKMVIALKIRRKTL